MIPSTIRTALLPALLLAAAGACRTTPPLPIPEPGTRPTTSSEPAAPEIPGVTTEGEPVVKSYSEADVRFLQHMIPHHAQALAMTALVPARTETPGVRLVAERIEASQRSEIATMQRWLRARGETVPEVAMGAGGAHAGHAAGAAMPDSAHASMPGMLSAAELERLASARGAEFDRLFLEYMIRHHEGAVEMVRRLLATPGAAQEAEIFQIASDVDADQRAEIARMRTLLQAR